MPSDNAAQTGKYGDDMREFTVYYMDHTFGSDPVETYGDMLAELDGFTDLECENDDEREFMAPGDVRLLVSSYFTPTGTSRSAVMFPDTNTQGTVEELLPDKVFEGLYKRIVGIYADNSFNDVVYTTSVGLAQNKA